MTTTQVSGFEPQASVVDRVVDPIVELGFWGFGIWTVAYHVGCWAGAPTTLLLAVTAAAMLAVAPLAWHSTRPRVESVDVDGWSPVRWLAWVSLALAVAAVVVLAPNTKEVFPWGWGLAAAALMPLVLVVVRGGRARPPRAAAVRRGLFPVGGSLLALGIGGTFAYLALRIVNPSFDDVFYVNKAVYVAEHGTIPLRDTIYTDQVLPALRGAGTVPVQSIEVLQGAVGHLFGFSGGTSAYFVTTAFVVVGGVWTIWALLRSWSRGPAVIGLLVSASYLLWGLNMRPGTQGSTAVSSVFLRGPWQGKVVFVSVLLPMIYLVLTRWVRWRRPSDLALLLVLGAAAVGLTSSATFLVPPLAVGATLAFLLGRNGAWSGGVALAMYPIGAGLVVSNREGAVAFGELLRAPDEAFYNGIGHGIWGSLGVLAILVAPWCVRRGGARWVAAASSAVAVAMTAPFVAPVLNELTGAGPVLWRLTWISPLPVLVGVLATGLWSVRIPRPDMRHWTVTWALKVVTPMVVMAAILAGGNLIWDPSGPARLEDEPTWKFPEAALDRAVQVEGQFPGNGTILAPRVVMSALALTTTQMHAVDPRAFFLSALDEPALLHSSRTILSRTMAPTPPRVPRTFGTHLDMLHVTLVCLDATQPTYRAAMTDLGWQESRIDPSFACFRRPV